MKKLFDQYDTNNSGKIEIKDLKKMMRDIKYKVTNNEI